MGVCLLGMRSELFKCLSQALNLMYFMEFCFQAMMSLNSFMVGPNV